MESKFSVQPTDTLKTADLIRLTGIGRNTLRFYEAEGLIPKPKRTRSGYRVYPSAILDDLAFIKLSKGAGFTLSEIKELIELDRAGAATCGVIASCVEQKMADIEARMLKFGIQKAFLARILNMCRSYEPSRRFNIPRRGIKPPDDCPLADGT